MFDINKMFLCTSCPWVREVTTLGSETGKALAWWMNYTDDDCKCRSQPGNSPWHTRLCRYLIVNPLVVDLSILSSIGWGLLPGLWPGMSGNPLRNNIRSRLIENVTMNCGNNIVVKLTRTIDNWCYPPVVVPPTDWTLIAILWAATQDRTCSAIELACVTFDW